MPFPPPKTSSDSQAPPVSSLSQRMEPPLLTFKVNIDASPSLRDLVSDKPVVQEASQYIPATNTAPETTEELDWDL